MRERCKLKGVAGVEPLTTRRTGGRHIIEVKFDKLSTQCVDYGDDVTSTGVRMIIGFYPVLVFTPVQTIWMFFLPEIFVIDW